MLRLLLLVFGNLSCKKRALWKAKQQCAYLRTVLSHIAHSQSVVICRLSLGFALLACQCGMVWNKIRLALIGMEGEDGGIIIIIIAIPSQHHIKFSSLSI